MSGSTLIRNAGVLVIGAGGRMGSAITGALMRSRQLGPPRLSMVARNGDSADSLRQRFPEAYVRCSLEPHDRAHPVDLVLLSTKPGDLLRAGIDYSIAMAGTGASPLVLSVLAGTPAARVGQAMQTSRVVTAMPNQGAQVGLSATGLFAPPTVSPQDRGMAEAVARTFGSATWVNDEHHMHGVTACAGSGTGFLFQVMERLEQDALGRGLAPGDARAHAIGFVADAMNQAAGKSPDDLARSGHPIGQAMAAMIQAATATTGLPRAQAHELVVRTVEGAVMLARTDDTPFAQRIDQVASPGGTTRAGLDAMTGLDLAQGCGAAVAAAAHRSIEMSQAGLAAARLPRTALQTAL